MTRPQGSNADEWAVFLEEYDGARSYIAVQIAEAIEQAQRQAIQPTCADRAFEILTRFATENVRRFGFGRRWYFSDEPLRNDAANLIRHARFQMFMPIGTRLVGDPD